MGIVVQASTAEENQVAYVTLRKQGNSVGITFPAETRTRLGFEVGQDLTIIEVEGGVKLVRRSSELEHQLKVAREMLSKHAGVLQGLADYDRDGVRPEGRGDLPA